MPNTSLLMTKNDRVFWFPSLLLKTYNVNKLQFLTRSYFQMSNLCVNTCSVLFVCQALHWLPRLVHWSAKSPTPGGIISKPAQTQLPWYLESSYSPTSPARQIGTAWLLMCLLSAGLVDKLLDSNYHGNWVWVGFEIIQVSKYKTVCRA